MEWEMNEEIVVSGISGRFPESDNVDELAKNLYDHVDMVTEDDRRWPVGLYGLPPSSGKIKDLSKFDAQFFGVHGKQANLMDPQARCLLELTYEAICDAGVNPYSLRGSKTGVYIGACVSEVEEGLAVDVSKVSGYALTGCSRSMFANRISYTFDFQGPSYAMDTACSSSFIAFQQAILGLRSGQCDQAIVGGVNICLRPVTALQFLKLGSLSITGKCRHMDALADGYARSDSCAVIFLQRKSVAKRIYASVLHVKTNTDGYKSEGITFPSGEAQRQLMEEVLQEAQIDPNVVEYVEAHGTGTRTGDPVEMNAIANVYCRDRPKPLLVGSVKSNIGHTEPASGLCSLAKVLIAFENRCIPANLHFTAPNPDIKPLLDGRIQPITDNIPFNGGIVGVNSFGFGGVNVHALVRSYDKKGSPDSHVIYDENMPRLVLMCGRTEPAVARIFDFINQNPKRVTREFLALVNEVAKIPAVSGMNNRGYTILKAQEENAEESLVREITRVPEKQPLWFVFSGMGSQWCAMAKALMPVPIFADAINECCEILKPFGVDLWHLLMSEDEKALDNIIAPFVTIAAVQIGLVDIFRALEIVPDGIVGHSVGELGCAYADGCFDRKQMILSAYWRGKCVDRYSGHQKGLMAAVGLGWQECEKRFPPGIVAACHNSEDSTTISGPYDTVKAFVAQLKSENIFAREVKSCDIAFHSPYVGPIGPDLEKELKSVLNPPKLRSSKWISSSVPEERWDTPEAKYSAPTYYVNNLVSPVLFQEALKYVPKNAILIEFAPHTLLQAILKRAIGADMVYLGLMKRNNTANNLEYLLQSIGKLYNLGFNPKIEALYPRVQFPVPTGTQSLGSLMSWDHSQNWLVTQYPEYFNPSSSSDYVIKVDLSEAEDAYLEDHVIDGKILFPFTGYLMLGWKMLAKIKGQFYDKLPVEFENVIISRATVVPKNGQVKFVIRMMETSGEFSISEGGAIVCTGRAFVAEEPVMRMGHVLKEALETEEAPDVIQLDAKDIYKELRLIGYDYGPAFRNLVSASESGRRGMIRYNGQWISFADNMLQVTILLRGIKALFLPTRIQSIRIDPKAIAEHAAKSELFPVAYDERINVCVTHGVEFRGLKTAITPRRAMIPGPVMEKSSFAPHVETNLTVSQEPNIQNYLQACCTLAQKIAANDGRDYMNGYKDSSEDVLNDYLASTNENYGLLRALAKMRDSRGTKQSPLELAKSADIQLDSDVLSNSLLCHERLLRSLLDVVSENSTGQLKVAEVNNTDGALMAPVVCPLLERAELKCTYAIGHPKPDTLAVTPETKFKYSVGDALPVDLVGLDLLIYRESISSNVSPASVLSLAADSLKDNGFALITLRSSLSSPETLLIPDHNGASRMAAFTKPSAVNGSLSLVGQKTDKLGATVLLYRKLADTKITSKTANIMEIDSSKDNYKWVDDLKKMLSKDGSSIWLVDNNPNSGLAGFLNCLKREIDINRVRCVINQSGSKIPSTVMDNIVRNGLVLNVYRKESDSSAEPTLGTYRAVTVEPQDENKREAEHAYLNVVTRGDLSSLRWFESEHKYHKQLSGLSGSAGELCQVYYAPLNFRDIMLATGKLSPDALPGDTGLKDCVLGLEFAGRDSSGRRVMGMVPTMGLATSVVVQDTEFLWPIPDSWTMEDAATVPTVYTTAYYSLIVRGNLQPGESVLIHSGSGGVGQAAISICLSMGCQVFTTVGTSEKREFLKRQFPQLRDEHIGNSRNTSFEQQILKATKGRGVDIVLNSLSEEKLHASIRCLAQHGRFLEIGKYDLSQNNPIGMAAFLKNIAFHGILLDSLFTCGSDGSRVSPSLAVQKQMVAQLVREGIKTGAVRPLRRTVFEAEEAEAAFRFMASGKHIGKVLLKLRDENSVNPVRVTAIPRTVFHPAKTYILNGGLGGFGLELAKWMITRGARNLVLVSRSGPRDGYQKMCLKRFSKTNTNVVVHKGNPSVMDEARKLITAARKLGPIGGIFNLAGILEDGIFENQTSKSFANAAHPKIDSTINFDKLSRSLPELEYFVCFSSVVSGRGNLGQTNYAFANSTMERIMEERRAAGYPGLAIQWGAVGDVGMIADNDITMKVYKPQRIPSCLAVMDQFLQSPYTVAASYVLSEGTTSTSSSSGSKDLLNTLANIMGLKNVSSIHPSMTLSELGLDSLMGVEVKQLLERQHDMILSLGEIRSLSLNQIKEISDGRRDVIRMDNTTTDHDTSMPVLSAPDEPIVKLNQVNDGKPVFFLPPIEGFFNLLTPLAKDLNRPAYGLNWMRPDMELPDIAAVAQKYYGLCRTVQPDGPLDLVGYSFGGLLALEMAMKNAADQIILLDSSPAHCSTLLNHAIQRLQETDPEDRHPVALVAFISQFVSIDYDETRAKLRAIESEAERCNKAAEIYIENGGPACNPSDLTFTSGSFAHKLKLISDYEPSGRPKAQKVLLIRADDTVTSSQKYGDDYGLSTLTDAPVEVKVFKGNHKDFISNNTKEIGLILNDRL